MKVLHCWEPGPDEEDGCSTTCLLVDNHEGPHEWTRDSEIIFTFDQIAVTFPKKRGV